jgi:uncharacterized protein YkwD
MTVLCPFIHPRAALWQQKIAATRLTWGRLINRLQKGAYYMRTLQHRSIDIRFSAILLLFFVPAITTGTELTTGDSSYFQVSPAEFSQKPEANESLGPETLDADLLAASIFHETNLRRQRHQLAPLEFLPEAREAAGMQSRLMAEENEVRHENPGQEGMETLTGRLQLAGLKPSFAAENVASAFMLQYKSGEPFFRRRENGELILSRQPDGPPIPPHTYLSFAEALLDQWMKSPGHRKNVLQEKARFLGTAAVPQRDETGMWLFYCTQVFFTPLPGN